MKTKPQLLVPGTRKIFLLLVSVLFIQMSKGQDSLAFRHATYKVIVGTPSDRRISVGYLSSISDTSVYISSLPVKFNGYAHPNANVPGISYNQIDDVRLRRTGSTGRGILIGVVAGALTGAIIGYASGDDTYDGNSILGCIFCFTAGEKAAAAGVGLGVAGGLIGGIVGALTHKTFIIKSKKEKFDELRWHLIH
jgi:hypothetical protein